MARPPNTQSLAVLIGEAMEAPKENAFAAMSAQEIDRLLISCRRAIHSHQRTQRSRDADTADTATAALEAIANVLAELQAVAPEEKRAKIAALISQTRAAL